MFRCQDIALRKEYVELVENVKDSGGDVKIFSSLHISGERKSYIMYIIFKLIKFAKYKRNIFIVFQYAY